MNLLAEIWTFLVLIVAMPKLVSSLGDTRFGLFSLAWVIIGYLAFLDIGVNRAATKFVSEHLAEQDLESTHRIVRAALVANLALGVLGGFAVALASPYLIHSIFKVSPDLESQARLTFYAVSLAVPVSLVQGVLRAILSSYQRFGWINLVNALATTAQWGLACGLAWKGFGVATVVLAVVFARFFASAAYGVLLLRLLPNLHLLRAMGLTGARKLLRFGSWVTVSQLVSPILVYLDRVLIASFVSLGAVTLYAVPYDMIIRLRVIPSSLAATLYPALGEQSGKKPEQREQLQRLYEGSVRYLLILTLPAALFLMFPGPDLLSLWMGSEFAQQASIVLQILGAGFLFNSLANIPYCTLQAVGRPDLTGKLHLLELPPYVVLCALLIPHWGIIGAAVANTLRLSVDAVLLFVAARVCCHSAFGLQFTRTVYRILIAGAFLATLLFVVHFTVGAVWGRLVLDIAGVFLYFASIWALVLDGTDKPRIFGALRVIIKQPAS